VADDSTLIPGLCPTWCTAHLPTDEVAGHHRRVIAIVGESKIEVEVEQLANETTPGIWIANAEGERITAAEAGQLAAALLDGIDIING
jgi:hypothetical protein